MAKVGDLVKFNRGSGPEYGIVVEVEQAGAKIAPLSPDATAPFHETHDASPGGEEFVVLK